MKVDLENKDEHIQTLIKLFETVSDTRKVVLFAEVLQKTQKTLRFWPLHEKWPIKDKEIK